MVGIAEESERKPNFRIYFSVSGCVKEVVAMNDHRNNRQKNFKCELSANVNAADTNKRFDFNEDKDRSPLCLRCYHSSYGGYVAV